MGDQGPDELLLATMNAQRLDLLSASKDHGARSWLRSSMRTEDGTAALLQQLQSHIAKDSFLAQLQHDAEHPTPAIPGSEGFGHEVLSNEWWSINDADSTEWSMDKDSYVMVEHNDVLDAIGAFVAAYLSRLPEAQSLQPSELQSALTQTFKPLHRITRSAGDAAEQIAKVVAMGADVLSLCRGLIFSFQSVYQPLDSKGIVG